MQRLKSRSATPDAEEEAIKRGLIGTPEQQEAAFEAAYARFARPLAAFIRETVAPTLDSDEVATAVSETFCGLAKYVDRGKFKLEGALSTLLFSIARLKAYDLLRKNTSQKRTDPEAKDMEITATPDGELSEEEFAARVSQRLIKAPEVRQLWKTAADSCSANEIIRQFRLWISTLPRLQRKVAQAILTHFGDVSDEEICAEIVKAGECSPSEGSVKSARKEIIKKFKTLIEAKERKNKS
jgi:RNA polymerase sigma factor (sigma-70 family)